MKNCLNCFSRHRQQSPGSAPAEPNCLNCFGKRRQHTPVSGSASTVEEVINSLNDISATADLKQFICIIKRLLEDLRSGSMSPKENDGMWTSFVEGGANFLKFVNEHTEKLEDEKEGKSRVVAEILDKIGELHWIVGALSIAAYLMEKCHQVSVNKAEALELLKNMVDLATTVAELKGDMIPEVKEKLKDAVMLIVQGSVMCVSQIYSKSIVSFFKTSVNSERLKYMSNKLGQIYSDLTLAILIANAKRQPILLPVPKPFYPKDAVGIENARDEVIKLLNMTSQNESTLAVVIYGFGGMGKTTLATSVVAVLDLNSYNFAWVNLDQERSKNDLKEKQQQILSDAFPNFHGGQTITLRDCQEGRLRLVEAFSSEKKPVFIFIDNVLRSEDLKEFLPEDLTGLPKRSKILLTTRRLDATDVIKGPRRLPFPMNALDKEHAIKILCETPEHRERLKNDMERIQQICGGVPLALKIVRGHLIKMGYDAGKCRQILKALEKGSNVKEENLSERLVDFVYKELEEGTQDAFLDICCFFNGWIRRHVEYIVGEEVVKSLEEAALITAFMDDKEKGEWAGRETEERLIVHDIVLARGRSMSASTRFMDVESFREAAKQDEKIQHTKGIWLGNDFDELNLEAKHVDLMSNLRVLFLGDRKRLNGQCQRTFEELRFLHISYQEDVFTKSTQLAFLRLHFMKEERKLAINLPESLRLLYLYAPEDSPLPIHINGRLTSLRELHLSCITFENFESSIRLGNFSCLKILKLNYVERLPESFGSLSSLQTLDMSSCSNLGSLPESFGSLSSLQTLNLNYCNKMRSLPDKFGHLKCLRGLGIRNCKELKSLHDDIVGLTALSAVKAYGCAELEAKSMDSLVEIKSLMFLEMGESPLLIKRSKEIQQHGPLTIGAALSLECGKYPYEEIMSTMFFNRGSRFLQLDGDEPLVEEEVASSSFPDVGVKVGLLITACDLSSELTHEHMAGASSELEIIYVDVDVEPEAEGSRWMEERKKRIRKTLLQLPKGSRAWTSSCRKTTLLLAFSLCHFTGFAVDEYNPLKHAADTSIVGTRVVVDEEGRRKLSEPLEMIFRSDGCDSRRLDFRTLLSPVQEAWYE